MKARAGRWLGKDTVDWQRRTGHIGLRLGAGAGLVALNAIFLTVTFAAFFFSAVGVDWDIYTEAGRRYFTGGLYEWGTDLPWRYSPLLAPLFALIAPIGYLGWSILHVAALVTLPWRIAVIALLSAPFWNDVYNGNTMTFVFVAAWHTLGGSRPGTFAFFVLALLIPRPVVLPVLGWVLWQRREWVAPFAIMAAAAAVGTLMTGWADEWLASEVGNMRRDIVADLGPANVVGSAVWYPIAFALAAWLTVKGRLGFASFLASGYWSLHYAIMLLLELRPTAPAERREPTTPAPT